MAGDYTRFTFKPQRDYSGVFKQQGRVDLDADFNELIEIIDRRWRSETIDIIKHCVVPNTTPNAYLITPITMGTFDIGIGRMYVDGIQVENHGLPPLEYQADLGELRGTAQVPYSDQPYLPAPLPPALTAAPNTTDLVYIDVWQREVTVLEDPTVREIALGGPDTTTRIQSVWQVRVLDNVGQHGCGDDIAIWDQTVAPSAGRLTTSAVAPPASDDPCIISPSGGYRGLENRLYRIEIHSPGPIGGGAPAKFKWSRNNAAIASTVSAIPSTTQVTVQQVGRDQVLRFEVGNWIEITDDFLEFQSLAGHLAQITAIDEANRILTFAPAIPGTINFDATNPERHTRVRRWDQSQNVDANGLLDVTGGPIDIEDGIRVGFNLDPVSGNFKIGDYWVFAARTADGSVEILQNAPPRGILHHYCRLGFIHWGTSIETTTFTDCREHWPPLCCEAGCTVTVGDGVDSHGQFTDIQQAIDALGNRGGVVCIGRGFYTVTAGLLLNNTKRNVILRGMGPATRIFFTPAEGVVPRVFLNIEGTEQVRLESVFVVSVNAEALVRITESHFCSVKDCILVNVPGRSVDQVQAAAVDLVEGCSHCEIARNALLAAKVVTATSGQVRELQVHDNQILALQVSVLINQGQGVEISHNQMRGLPREAFTTDTNLSRDTIDAFQVLVSNAFRATPAFSNYQAAGVLIITGNRVVISQNLITAQVAVLGFLVLNARIHQNDIVSLIGALVVYGIRVKVEDNFVLGLFAGLIHAGIIVDLDCTSNEWLGLNGIIWMSLVELAEVFVPLLGTAIGSANLAASGTRAVDNTATAGIQLAGNLRAFGLALINKVHRNVFFTFSRGLYKTGRVLSADVSIVDNSFSLCSQAGIEFGGGGRNNEFFRQLLPVISLRHLIQANAMAVQGKGIISSSRFTDVEKNSVQCPSVAIELNAALCNVRNNSLIGTAPELSPPGPPEEGLLILHNEASGSTVSGNRLINASGHAILLRDELSNVAIEENDINQARRFGIGTVSNTTVLKHSSISRNRVRTCQGNVSAGSLQFGGAIVIGVSQNVRFVDNVIADNTPVTSGEQVLHWFAVYLEDTEGVEFSGNTVTGNAAVAGIGGILGAIGLLRMRGAMRIQNNIIRENGGIALLAIGQGQRVPEQGEQVLVQNNHFSEGPNRSFRFVSVNAVESLLFQGNQCHGTAQAPFVLPPIFLFAARANVTGNVVDLGTNVTAIGIGGENLLVSANSVRSGDSALAVTGIPVAGGPVRVIVTSNLATGISPSSTGVLILANNIP
jgi:hypothetical protein